MFPRLPLKETLPSVCVCACVCACIPLCVRAYLCVCMCVHACMCVCVCVCVGGMWVHAVSYYVMLVHLTAAGNFQNPFCMAIENKQSFYIAFYTTPVITLH